MERIIVHLDMDAFFASVEQSKKPWLRRKAIAVSGNPNGRSVVATCSYEARRYGIHSGMPLSTAKKLYPELIIIKCSMNDYEAISENIYNLCCEYSPAVEYFSVDEVFMDFSYLAKSYEDALLIAKTIKFDILKRFGLTCSIGISYNKLIAKLASKLCKPNGLMCIKEEEALDILKTLPVGKITGIGKRTEELLKDNFNVETVGDLMKIPLLDLTKVFHSYGKFLYEACRGIDESPVITQTDLAPPKSVGNSVTLEKDTDDIEEIKAVLKMLSAKVSSRLRSAHFEGKRLTITVRYHDFQTFTHAIEIQPTNLDSEIYAASLKAFMEVYNGSEIRLLGVSMSLLQKTEEASLFDGNQNEKEKKVLEAMDTARKRFGYNKLEYGTVNALKGDFVLKDKKISGA